MNMKNKFNFCALCLIGTLTVGFTGCKDLLSHESPSAMGSEFVFSSPARCEQAIAGVYEVLGANNFYINRLACGFFGLNTDIEHSTYSTSDKAGQAPLVLYDMSDVNDQVSNANKQDSWAYFNIIIERCNNIIDGITDYGKDDALTQYCLGEALFLRSFAYLEMVKMWGDVPARFEPLGKNPDGVNIPKTDRNVIYAQVIADLKRAAEILPWSDKGPSATTNDDIRRPSKQAALALRARADLMYAGKALRPDNLVRGGTSACSVRDNLSNASDRQAVYQDALEACAEIIKYDGDAKLKRPYEQVFKDLCQDKISYRNTEYLWVIPFADGNRGRFLSYNTQKLTNTGQADGLNGHLKNFDASFSVNAVQLVTPNMVFAFEPGDERKAVTVATGVWYYNDAVDVSSDPDKRAAIFPGVEPDANRLYEKNNKMDKYFLGKYRVEWMNRTVTGLEDGVDFPVIRYADVLLMFAEASLGGIQGDVPANNTGLNGKDMLDKVRNRAGLAPAAQFDMDAIINERAAELCGEYVRKNDLMRWGKLEEKLKASNDYIRKMASPEGRAELNINDTIYFKYTFDNDVQGYKMTDIWGLRVDELGRPAGYDPAAGWVAKDVYTESGGAYVLSTSKYPIYANEENLMRRQLWPIFRNNWTISNGTLWNDYGY